MVVSCLVKNGGYYVKEFVRHYQAMGASHIVVLDNGSTDDTVERFAVHDGVTVYRCELPVGRYQHLMKRAAATQLVGRGWCLDVDIDEFFDYPFSARMPLKDFIRYLDDSGFDAVVTQMVDMYSAEPIGYLAEAGTIFRPSDYPYYDLAEIAHESYRDAEIVRAKASANLVDGPDPGINWGGVRHRLFQLRCLLTKHSMFRVDRDLRLFTHPHFCDGAKLADVSGILRHYKLVSNCYETSTLNRGAFVATRQGYADLVALIEREPEQRIYDERLSLELESVDELLRHGLLVSSADFRGAVPELTQDSPPVLFRGAPCLQRRELPGYHHRRHPVPDVQGLRADRGRQCFDGPDP